jgi:hypothetical protein
MLPLLLWALGTASAGDAPTYALKPDGGEASCFAYTVLRDGQPLTDLPAELKDALGCAWAMSLNGNRLIFMGSADKDLNRSVRMINLDTRKVISLFSVYPFVSGSGGISVPVWSDDGRHVLFHIVNQDRDVNQDRSHGYTAFGRLIVVRVDGDTATVLRKFDRPVMFVCGSICSGDARTDYGFKDNRTIMYRRHEMIEDRPGVVETIVFDPKTGE